MPRLALLSLAVAFGAAAGACSPSTLPDRTLSDYGGALKAHDYASAYALMSSSFRSKVSLDQYKRMMTANPKEVDETAERLRGKHPVEQSAEVEYGFGDQLKLVFEDKQWRIASNPLAFYDQSTPKAALRSFVRAWRLERWDVMLGFVPKEYRDRMDAAKIKQQFTDDQTKQLMETLAANIDAPIDERANEARMHYGDKYEVKFKKEDNLWMLQDLD
jgi:hypothetical protein